MLIVLKSSSHFPGASPFIVGTSASEAVAPLHLPAGSVLWVSVARGRRAGETGRRAAATLQSGAVSELLAGRGGAQGALQGGGGAARARGRAEEHPTTVLH